MKRLSVVLLMASLTMASADCGAAEKNVKFVDVALILPLTGKFAETGKFMKEGVEFVVDAIRKEGGIKSLGGASIRLSYGDTASDPKSAAAEAERLFSMKKPSVIIGPYSSGEAQVVGPLAESYKVPNIAVRSTTEALYPLKLKYWYQLGMPINRYGQPWSEAFYDFKKEFGIKMERIALVGDDMKVIQDLFEGVREVIKEHGDTNKIVGDIKIDPRAPDLSSVAARVKSLNPDVQFGPIYFGPAMVYFRAQDSVGHYPPIQVMADTTASPKAWTALGKELADKMIARPGVYFSAYFHPGTPLPGVQAFVKMAMPYMEKKGFKELDIDFIMGAQAMMVVRRALEKTGSVDPNVINDFLRKVKIADTELDFIVPAFSPELGWKPTGEPLHAKWIMNQYIDGKLEVIWPKAVRTHKPSFPPSAFK